MHGFVAARRVDDVEPRFIGRKGEPVRPLHVVDRDCDLARALIDAVDTEWQLLFRLVPEIVAANAGAVIAEPDRAVGFDDDVVGAGQPLPVKGVRKDRDPPVIFGARQPLRTHLAGNQPPDAVPRVAVGVIGGLAEHADRSRLLLPFQDAVVRDVAEQEVAPVTEPYRAFGKTAAAGDPLDRRHRQRIFRKARVENFDVGVGIADRRRPRVPPRSTTATADFRRADRQRTAAYCHVTSLLTMPLTPALSSHAGRGSIDGAAVNPRPACGERAVRGEAADG